VTTESSIPNESKIVDNAVDEYHDESLWPDDFQPPAQSPQRATTATPRLRKSKVGLPQYCGLCGEKGHNARSCSNLK
jgi:hypothetical protein